MSEKLKLPSRALGDCGTWYSGGTPSTNVSDYWNGDIPWITSSSLKSFYISTSERKITALGAENGTRIVPSKTILFVTRGMSLKTEFRVGITQRPVAFGQDCKALIAKEDIEPLYLSFAIQSQEHRILDLVDEASHGTGRLQTDALKSVDIPLPPLPEQRKIAEILGTWDEAIATVEALIGALSRRKRGLMQRLLTGEVRFAAFAGEDWEEVEIGNVLKEIRRPIKDFSADREYHLLSVRRRSQGLFFRETRTGEQLERKGMFEVRQGDFLISKRQVVHGASGLTDENHNGYVVSNSYHALVTRNKNKLDIHFFNWLSRTPYLYHLSYVASHGVHVEKLFFTLGAYFRRQIKIPPTVKEQQKIIEALNSLEDTISSYETYSQALKEQKKGLMQRLLTGQVRVGVDEQAEPVIE